MNTGELHLLRLIMSTDDLVYRGHLFLLVLSKRVFRIIGLSFLLLIFTACGGVGNNLEATVAAQGTQIAELEIKQLTLPGDDGIDEIKPNTSTPKVILIESPINIPIATGTPGTSMTATIAEDGRVYLGDLLIFDFPSIPPGCFPANSVLYSPTGEYFLLIIPCFEGGDEAFLFLADGSSMIRITGEWDLIENGNIAWAQDGKSFTYKRINSCCVTPPADAPPPGQVRYFVDSGVSLLISPEATPVSKPIFTAEENMFCRDGPYVSFRDRVTILQGERVPVLARWENDWLLVSISSTDTRSKCCWIGGKGHLNTDLSAIRLIDENPDRFDCKLP